MPHELTTKQLDTVESFLECWYHWSKAQREFLGYPSSSFAFRLHKSNDVYNDEPAPSNHEAEVVESVLSTAPLMTASIIELHFARKFSERGATTRAARLFGSAEAHHKRYVEIKTQVYVTLQRLGVFRS